MNFEVSNEQYVHKYHSTSFQYVLQSFAVFRIKISDNMLHARNDQNRFVVSKCRYFLLPSLYPRLGYAQPVVFHTYGDRDEKDTQIRIPYMQQIEDVKTEVTKRARRKVQKRSIHQLLPFCKTLVRSDTDIDSDSTFDQLLKRKKKIAQGLV
ncbi:hypothetical protein K435DRAFT_793927 [Dendrothele bispora CBS 962.96]|uniref:Uncharacterized protein n=1 Tax=Dendrothele bispora (strain CBS 962.96) TaxID=1314807 RepID=A0A4S8MF21_DENBC|nr:hypothetical protein K435DRAFT_793927 [Dendrothele bispora CBS 962.96]